MQQHVARANLPVTLTFRRKTSDMPQRKKRSPFSTTLLFLLAILFANSSSQLPVEYHIAYGPAKINNGNLSVAELPRRVTFPIEAKVVAYQFGRGLEPRIQTAKPVEQILQILAPSDD